MFTSVVYDHKECRAKENAVYIRRWFVTPSAQKWKLCGLGLRKFFLASPKSIETVHFLRSEFALGEEQRRQMESKQGFMIHPFSDFLFVWRLLIMITFILSLMLDPMQVYLEYDLQCFFKICKYIFDSIAMANVLVKFLTAHNNDKTKETNFSLKESALAYLGGKFVIDIMGSLPFEFLVPIGVINTSTVLILKSFRWSCLFEYFNKICYQYQCRIMTKTQLEIFLKSMIFIQILSACYYQLEREISGKEQERNANNRLLWFMKERLYLNSTPALQRYTITLFFVSGLITTSGRSESRPELIVERYLSIVIMLLGYIFYCHVIILSCNNRINSFWEEINFSGTIREVWHYSNRKRFPPELLEKINIYLNHKFHGKIIDEEEIVEDLSEHLKMEMKLDDCEHLIHQVPFFHNLPQKAILDIAKELKLNIHLPGETLITPQAIADKLYLIKFGSVSITKENKQEIMHLKDFDYFGESSILRHFYVHDFYVTTTELSEIYSLDKSDWEKIIWKYPTIAKQFDKRQSNVLEFDKVRQK